MKGSKDASPPTRRTTVLMAVGCDVAVANLHDAQPLPPGSPPVCTARGFSVGHIPALRQLGNALGLLPLPGPAQQGVMVLCCVGAGIGSLARSARTS